MPCPTLTSTPQKLFSTPEQLQRTSDPLIFYSSASRIETLVSWITAVIMLALIALPLVILSRVDAGDKGSSLSIIVFILFVCLFSIAAKIVFGVNRHELFAALAVYCAVLATFIGNTGQEPCRKQ